MHSHTSKLSKNSPTYLLTSPKSSFLNSFMFTDQMTHASINVEQMHHILPKKIYYSPKKQNCSSGIDECLQMLKSTKKFQILSLQTKNYHTKTSKNNSEIEIQVKQDLKSEKKISKVRKQFQERKKREKQDYLKDKENLSLYLQNDFEYAENQQPNKLDLTSPTKQAKQIEIKQNKVEEERNREQQLIKNFQNQINYTFKKDSQFLITPKPKKLFLVKKSKRTERTTAPFSFQSKISGMNFSTEKEQEVYEKYFCKSEAVQNQNIFEGDKEHSKGSRQYRQVVKAIKQGRYFKVQIQLSLNPLLLDIVDDKGNNLLHLSVLTNRQDIFQMILAKCISHDRENLLFSKNKFQRTPLQLIRIFGIFKKTSIQKQLDRIKISKRMQLVTDTFNFTKSMFYKRT